MKTTSVLSAFLIPIVFCFAGCVSGPPRDESFRTWTSSFPAGFKKQIEVARAASKAYHAITDTSIKELQTREGARRIGDLVTAARDKYRHWKSYGNYTVPGTCNGHQFSGVNYGSGLDYSRGKPGKSGDVLTWFFTLDSRKRPPVEGTIKSSRGRIIFGGRYGDESNWALNSPFNDILKGDRMEDIKSLIGRIKR